MMIQSTSEIISNIKQNIKKLSWYDLYLQFKIGSLVAIPIVIEIIHELTRYYKDININLWLFGAIVSTIVALLIYKSFYMPIGYKVKLDNKSFIIVLLGLIFLKSVGLLIWWLINFNQPQNQKEWENIWNKNQDSLHYYAIEGVIVAPVIEEVLFRGVLFFAAYMLIKELKNMKKWKFSNKTNQYITATLFILVSSFLFSSMHLSQSFLMSLPYLFFGITLAIIFVITKNLLITITIHVLNNSLSFFSFFQSNAKQEDILTQEYILLLSLLLISTIIFFFNKTKTKSHS